jgi:hypothetical protein
LHSPVKITGRRTGALHGFEPDDIPLTVLSLDAAVRYLQIRPVNPALVAAQL